MTAAELADELAAQATELAAALRRPQRHPTQSRRIAARAGGRAVSASRCRCRASLRRAGGAGRAAPAPPAPVEIPAEAGADELLDLAEEQWRQEHRRGRCGAVLAVFDARFGEPETVRLRAQRAELRAAELAGTARTAEALAANREAGRRLTAETGDLVREARWWPAGSG